MSFGRHRSTRIRARVFYYSLALFVLTTFSQVLSWGYVRTPTDGGTSLHWDQDKLYFAGNPANHSQFSEAFFFEAITHGLQRWRQGSLDVFNFDYWQGSRSDIYHTNSDFNGYSNIYFSSASGTDVDPQVVGYTQVWYDPDNGKILEADIILNDGDFLFTQDPRDAGQEKGGPNRRPKVFLENVVTHELGHALGIAHSGVLQSSMFYTIAKDHAFLGCDDLAGIRGVYPSSFQERSGNITGRVLSEQNAPIFGAQVQAISQKRGTVLAGALTQKDGSFVIQSLEPGSYVLMMEAFPGGTSALPPFYQQLSQNICGSGMFPKQFWSKREGALQDILVQEGVTSSVGDLNISCETLRERALFQEGDFLEERSFDPRSDSQKAWWGRLEADTSKTLELSNLSGVIEIRVLSFSLFSPVQVLLEMTDALGEPVKSEFRSPVFRSASSYANWDSWLKTASLSRGKYFLKLTPQPLSSAVFPAGLMSSEGSSLFAVFVQTGGASAPMMAEYPSNAACRQSDDFGTYQSPSGDPPRMGGPAEKSSRGFLGFCGQVSDQSKRPPSDGSFLPSVEEGIQIFMWFIPWIFMVFTPQLFVRRLRFQDKILN